MEVGRMNGVLNYMYVMAKVKPEQRQTADWYQTWILCNRNGEVKSPGCGCVAVSAAYVFSLFTVQMWQVLLTIYPEFPVQETNVPSSAIEIVYPGH